MYNVYIYIYSADAVSLLVSSVAAVDVVRLCLCVSFMVIYAKAISLLNINVKLF